MWGEVKQMLGDHHGALEDLNKVGFLELEALEDLNKADILELDSYSNSDATSWSFLYILKIKYELAIFSNKANLNLDQNK